MNILIADDNIDTAESLLEALELEGCLVKLAFGGAEAIEMYRSGSFDLVLMDMKMPNVDGREATRQILGMDPNARIVIVTGNIVREDVEQISQMGIVDILRKPFHFSELLKVISQEMGTN